MTVQFAELLEEEAMVINISDSIQWNEYKKSFDLASCWIPVRALGEWAWKQIEGNIRITKFGGDCLEKQIAVACLGEKEVRKRLKEAGGGGEL